MTRALASGLLLAGAAAPGGPVASAQSTASLFATVSPSPFIHLSASADIVAALPAGVSAAAVQVAFQGSAGGFRLTKPSAAQRSHNIVAVVTAGATPGRATVSVTVPSTGEHTSLPLESYAKAAQLVAGKGAWISFDAYGAMTFAAMLGRMANEGVTHVYVETTGHNFIGAADLNALVAQAHDLGIAVVAFAWAPLNALGQEIASARQTINYTTPYGAKIDGFAGDFEINLGAGAMGTFSSAVRRALGPDRAYVAIIYAPQFGFRTPIGTLARYVDVFAPMDYWDSSVRRAYTPAYAANFVATSIRELHAAPGEANIPIEVVSQTQDIASNSGFGPLNPPAAQVAASARAAAADGAIGVSFYELVNQTPAQIAAITTFHMS